MSEGVKLAPNNIDRCAVCRKPIAKNTPVTVYGGEGHVQEYAHAVCYSPKMTDRERQQVVEEFLQDDAPRQHGVLFGPIQVSPPTLDVAGRIDCQQVVNVEARDAVPTDPRGAGRVVRPHFPDEAEERITQAVLAKLGSSFNSRVLQALKMALPQVTADAVDAAVSRAVDPAVKEAVRSAIQVAEEVIRTRVDERLRTVMDMVQHTEQSTSALLSEYRQQLDRYRTEIELLRAEGEGGSG